jgi:hypothetical protein
MEAVHPQRNENQHEYQYSKQHLSLKPHDTA